MSDLLKTKMNDGWRHFVELPEAVLFGEFRAHAEKLKEAKITDFITGDVVEMWLDFEYRGKIFSVNNQFGDYWVFCRRCKLPGRNSARNRRAFPSAFRTMK